MLLRKLILIFFLLSGTHSLLWAQVDSQAGEALFKARCTSCHAIGKRMVGPDLKDVADRHDTQWLIKFIHSSQALVQAGDKEAVAIFEANNRIIMPDHLDLNPDEIKNIVAYIGARSREIVATKTAPQVHDDYLPYGGEVSLWHQIIYLDFAGDHKPVTAADSIFWAGIFFAVVLGLLLLIILVKENDFIDKIDAYQKSKKEEQANKKD